MSWFRKSATSSPTEADNALNEAKDYSASIDRRLQEIEPLICRLEDRRESNFIAEAVEETLRRGDQ